MAKTKVNEKARSMLNLSQADLDHLAAVIGEAEARTSGEIRLMIVKRSHPIGHIMPVLWLVFVTIGMIVLWFNREAFLLTEAPWWLVPGILLLSGLVAWPAARAEVIQRLFTSPQDLRRAVWWRAELEFHREGLFHTQGATGILLFLSLFERHAVVLADRGISSKLDPKTWDGVVALIQEGERGNQWKDKLDEAIRLCGRLLSEHFPVTAHGENQLPNTIIIKE